jgi:hypothetical protein
MVPTTVKSATPFRLWPLGAALGAGVSDVLSVLSAGSDAARFERLPRSAPSLDSKSSSSAGASAEDSSARARTERRAGVIGALRETRAFDARARDAEARGAADATTGVATRVVMANMMRW